MNNNVMKGKLLTTGDVMNNDATEFMS